MAVPCALSTESVKRTFSTSQMQKTLSESVSISGIGLFSGEKVTLTIHPAPSGTGILFQRIDLPDRPVIPATLDYVVSTPRCTVLGQKKCSIYTVEHLLASLKACGIDNAWIELNGPEVPILDGSSIQFVELIESAGIAVQDKEKTFYLLSTPLFWSQGDIHLIALPSEEYRISYTLHYPHSKILRSQYFSKEIDAKVFKTEIASCRTFCLYEEITPMIEKGLIKGGTLENGVIIKEDSVMNPEGLRFPDEMVRHKVLDLIGDLSLIPISFYAHIIAIRAGHASNVAFGKDLFNHIKMENAS
ncbi:MAG TPA: UDP-3-O-acyl-N-acetylglucosamine deacetylase [Rhabdochlamydiaceae bacterium]|nr:UDP-3-O-acyl-N-acetylglucosamine deacetylase [Rhabdochlamydiaceae bacterium]